MTRHRTITVRFRREALHHWPSAPEEVAFLRNPHRHEFHVSVTVRVRHNERELEFFLFRQECERLCTIPDNLHTCVTKSCETFAEELLEGLRKRYDRSMTVTVSEDGENEATIHYHPS